MTQAGLDEARPNRLGVGKIPIRILNSTVLRMVGAESDRIVTPAKAGVDFAAVKVGGGYMLVSADPITGVSKEIGRYAVMVSANDVATSGCRPQFAESVILLPEGSNARDVGRVARQIHDTAKESGISILGGHTEVTPGLRNDHLRIRWQVRDIGRRKGGRCHGHDEDGRP
jgi:hydrogenase maturation factor